MTQLKWLHGLEKRERVERKCCRGRERQERNREEERERWKVIEARPWLSRKLTQPGGIKNSELTVTWLRKMEGRMMEWSLAPSFNRWHTVMLCAPAASTKLFFSLKSHFDFNLARDHFCKWYYRELKWNWKQVLFQKLENLIQNHTDMFSNTNN